MNDYASRCKACNRRLEPSPRAKALPDGSCDDLCSSCKEAIYTSNGVRYRDYDHEFLDDDVIFYSDEL